MSENIYKIYEQGKDSKLINKNKLKDNSLINVDALEEDKENFSLRPTNFNNYIGQEKIKNNLSISMKAAKKRKEHLDHILLFGPPGLGKTTLAFVLSYEMEAELRVSSAPMIDKPSDLAAILTNLKAHDILFIDEIHRLNRSLEEILYSAMEDYRLDIIIGSGPAAQTIKIDLAPFTLIGATTRAGMLSKPLRDRFGMSFRMQYYSILELSLIISLAAKKLGKPCNKDALEVIAKRSRGTPRVSLRLLKRIRDYAEVHNEGEISKERALSALEELGVDKNGFDSLDLDYIKLLLGAKKALGLNTISAALSEDEETIEDLVEPYLLANELIIKTSKGRLASAKLKRLFNIKEDAGDIF